MFLISLTIGSQCLEIRSDHCRDTATLGLSDNFAGVRLALAERFLEALDRHRQADFVAISETVRNCFDDPKYLYGHTLDDMGRSGEALASSNFSSSALRRLDSRRSFDAGSAA
ncbi:hypothetical protein ACVJBD_000449 [Rhizobium mongolense]